MLFLAFLLLAFAPVHAQKDKGKEKAKTPKKTAVAEGPSPADLLYENMLENTQRVLVIDSVVVDKERFLDYIPLPKECGTLTTAAGYFNNEKYGNGVLNANEFGNKTYYAQMKDGKESELFTRDKLGKGWTDAVRLEGIDASRSPNYPFMMADGITFYFAQKGEGCLGGFDIFVTRYDSESGSFLRPNNIGLPFNSKANDYMYVEDELDSLGWFVTDRGQAEGKVCVYTFVPTKKRSNFNLDDTDEEVVRSYAALSSIKATWTDTKAKDAALKRLNRLKSDTALRAGKPALPGVCFVINDRLTYRNADEFQSSTARQAFYEWQQATERLKEDSQQLAALRERYALADDSERSQLRSTILEAEQELERLQSSIHEMEKNIRKEELKVKN